MSQHPLLPDRENLRRAVKWLSEQGGATLQRVEEASVRFDLSPADADFLLRNFVYKQEQA